MINKIDKYRYESMPQEKINEKFLEACKIGNLELIEYFLLDSKIKKANIEYKNYECVFIACREKHLNILNFLLTSERLEKKPSINLRSGYLLTIAFQNHDLDIIDYLLDFKKRKRVDIEKNGEQILKTLMNNFQENSEMIKLLIIQYKLPKTQNITDFLNEKNYKVQEKKITNEWFDKRDLNNVLNYYLQEDAVNEKKVKKNKI